MAQEKIGYIIPRDSNGNFLTDEKIVISRELSSKEHDAFMDFMSLFFYRCLLRDMR